MIYAAPVCRTISFLVCSLCHNFLLDTDETCETCGATIVTGPIPTWSVLKGGKSA